jgi:hypothetical protein
MPPRPPMLASGHCADGAAIDNSQRPINLLVTREAIEQRLNEPRCPNWPSCDKVFPELPLTTTAVRS